MVYGWINQIKLMSYITKTKLLQGFAIQKIGFFASKKQFLEPKFKNYSLIKHLGEKTHIKPLIGLYADNVNKQVVIKQWNYMLKTVTYYQLLHEMNVLKFLNAAANQFVNKNIFFPKFIEQIRYKNRVGYVAEYISGKPLTDFPTNFKIEIANSCLEYLVDLSASIKTSYLKNFPKVRPIQNILVFPFFWLIVVIKDIKNVGYYLKFLWAFYKLYLNKGITSSLVINHRDLHSDNVIISKNKTYILDTEVMVLAEKETDLALVAKAFYKQLGNKINQLLKIKFAQGYSVDKFIALSIFYSLQIMAISSHNSQEYKEATEYMFNFVLGWYGHTKRHLSLAESVMHVALHVISWINKFLKPFIRPRSKPLILCYHSISQTDWRFAVDPSEFEKQLKYLTTNFNISSIDQVAAGAAKPNSVVITFDDGYLDNLKIAAKILKKYSIQPSLFTVGDLHHPNRQELDNDLPLLSLKQIKQLKTKGWSIGFHTKTHADMRGMSEAEITEEITFSKRKLEKELGFTLKYFAYPRGIYNSKIISIVKKAGFKMAFTVDGDYFQTQDDLYLKDRISMEKDINIDEFSAMLSPLGIWFMQTFMSILKLKEQTQYSVRKLLKTVLDISIFKMEVKHHV